VVWGDHLRPMLTYREAVRLQRTCKVLKKVVREHYKDLSQRCRGGIRIERLHEMLTTFPSARVVPPYCHDSRDWTPERSEALMQWLRGEGHGGAITAIMPYGDGAAVASTSILEAWRAGALPSLKRVAATPDFPSHRAVLTEVPLGGVHELCLRISSSQDWEPQLPALGVVRQLPVLTKLTLQACAPKNFELLAQWPAFIPASLNVLSIVAKHSEGLSQSLLIALPGVIGASGAVLERLEIEVTLSHVEKVDDRLINVAQALRCSPTLRVLNLSKSGPIFCRGGARGMSGRGDANVRADHMEQLRVQWADVISRLSSCRELQVLVLPSISVELVFPPDTFFAHLVHLRISDDEREHPPGAGVMGLWELMASGGLPALTKLKVTFEGRLPGLEKTRTRVAPALEAVAGTLTHLHLTYGGAGRSDERAAYELGVAVGKLRRLKKLTLDLFEDGRAYHAVAQGLAAGGSGCPLPLLWRVAVISFIQYDDAEDLLTSLLLPSVRVFSFHGFNFQSKLRMACALRQVGYSHNWVSVFQDLISERKAALQAVSECNHLNPHQDRVGHRVNNRDWKFDAHEDT
jgi:hypothetical protein